LMIVAFRHYVFRPLEEEEKEEEESVNRVM
jgi:hypothetical protein